MVKLSNYVFFKLAADRSNRLHTLATKRFEKEPQGSLTTHELDELALICKYSHEDNDVTWLRTLGTLLTSGRLASMLHGKFSYQDHVAEINNMVAQEKIPYGIKDLVVLKDGGKSGVIADYNTDTKEYMVILNPFQLRNVPAKDLLAPSSK
jgi:hypothetical protein